MTLAGSLEFRWSWLEKQIGNMRIEAKEKGGALEGAGCEVKKVHLGNFVGYLKFQGVYISWG